jgi:hypothetical protein
LRAWEPTLLELTEKSTLSFPLTLIDGTSIETVGEAANYFSSLSEEQRGQGHWTIAIRMLNHALKEPAYLKAATLSLQSALLLQGLSSDPQPLGPSSR